MFINELFSEAEVQNQLVVLYPGRFQPFHLGHRDVFASLQSKFGRDAVYIATSNKTELPKSPFNFSDKTIFMNAAGVPTDRILEVTSPYKLPAQFTPDNTIFIVAVGAPDADRLKPDSLKKDGTAGYYKTFKSIAECETADKHGYVIIAAERHKDITINGQQVDVSHGTQSRAAWNSVRNDPKARGEFLVQMFGRNDPEVGRVLDKIPVNEDSNMPVAVDSASAIPGISVLETIRKVSGGYRLVSKKGKNLGTYPTHAGAEKRERQVQYFKHMGEEAAGVGVVKNSKDPRYVMATMGDQNDVTAATLPKMMKAYGLTRKMSKAEKLKEAESLLEQIRALREELARTRASINKQ